MDAKIQILSEDRTRLQTIEKEHQTLQYENVRLKSVDTDNLTLQKRIQVLQQVETKHKEAVEKIVSLEVSATRLSDENKQIAVLKENMEGLGQASKELQIFCEQQKETIHEQEKQCTLLKQKIESLSVEVAEKKVISDKLKSLETEHQSMKKTIEDYHNANTNNEMSQQILMKEVEELRKVEAQHQGLVETHQKTQSEACRLQSDLQSYIKELNEMTEVNQLREKEALNLKKVILEQEESQKVEVERMQQSHTEVQESNRKYELLVKDLACQKKEKEGLREKLEQATGNVQHLKTELLEVKQVYDKERTETQLQLQRLAELREVEINYKIMLSENTALKSVSENLKNLSFAYEKSEQKCQSLREENAQIDQVRIENTELKCHVKSMEVGLKDDIAKREKLTLEILELKGEIENVKTRTNIEVSRKSNDFENERTVMKKDFEAKISEVKTEMASMKVNLDSKLLQVTTEKDVLQRSVDELTSLKTEISSVKNNLECKLLAMTAEKDTIQRKSADDLANFKSETAIMSKDLESKLLEVTMEKEKLQNTVDELAKLKTDWIHKEEEMAKELENAREAQQEVFQKNENCGEQKSDSEERIKDMELLHLNELEERDAKFEQLLQELDHLKSEYGIDFFFCFNYF